MSNENGQHEYHEEASPCGGCEEPHHNLFKCIECRITLCGKCYQEPDKHEKECRNARQSGTRSGN